MARYRFAELGQWATKNKRRMDAVVKGSTQDVVAIAQTPKAKGGRMPVDTGFLRNSLMSSISGGLGVQGAASYVMVAAGMKGGDMATFQWTAEYARFVNDGANGRTGAFFLEGAADQWPQIVRRNVAKAKAAVR